MLRKVSFVRPQSMSVFWLNHDTLLSWEATSCSRLDWLRSPKEPTKTRKGKVLLTCTQTFLPTHFLLFVFPTPGTPLYRLRVKVSKTKSYYQFMQLKDFHVPGTFVALPDSAGSLWILELHNRSENLLTHDVINHGLKPAIDVVEQEWRMMWRKTRTRRNKEQESSADPSADGSGALIITGHGIDFARAVKDTSFFSATLNPLFVKLLTFPIPVIAAINGHSFTAGVMVALSCDYRIMIDSSKRNAWTCMTEIHMGAPWPDSFVAITDAKVASPRAMRTLALEGARISPQEALSLGIVDKLVHADSEKNSNDVVLTAARELAWQVARNARAGAWGLIKKHLYRDALEKIATDYRLVMAEDDDAARAHL